jgi:hypothetical protein
MDSRGDFLKIGTGIEGKIRVFISSKCRDEKYDTIRRKLKKLIEDTGIAKVYLFEARLVNNPEHFEPLFR